MSSISPRGRVFPPRICHGPSASLFQNGFLECQPHSSCVQLFFLSPMFPSALWVVLFPCVALLVPAWLTDSEESVSHANLGPTVCLSPEALSSLIIIDRNTLPFRVRAEAGPCPSRPGRRGRVAGGRVGARDREILLWLLPHCSSLLITTKARGQ